MENGAAVASWNALALASTHPEAGGMNRVHDMLSGKPEPSLKTQIQKNIALKMKVRLSP
jgi:hypothetical protein